MHYKNAYNNNLNPLPPRRDSLLTPRKSRGFTLVELIVVIVILAILATIAFLSFSSQSASARDSTRLSDMSNIAKGLSVFNANAGTYPKPDSSVSITASGVEIGRQGYAGATVLNMIKISNGGKDPLDTSAYYTYNINANQSKFQMLGFLEDGSNVALSYIPHGIPAFAGMTEGGANADPGSYSGRYVITKGDQLGILLSSGSMVPVQASAATYGNSIELKSYTGGEFVGYINKTVSLSGTGGILGGLAGYYTVTSAGSKYPDCDTNDIRLGNGQVWAACNVGAITSNGYNMVPMQIPSPNTNPPPDRAGTVEGNYFQWGRNADVTLSPNSSGPVISETGSNFYTDLGAQHNWLTSINNGLWGGSGTTSTGGTYISLGMPALMQGPCAIGYHIPTMTEWINAISSLNPTMIIDRAWHPDISAFNVLKLPLAGFRYYNGDYRSQGYSGYYWASSPDGNYGYSISISGTQIYPLYYGWRATGFSIRCLKN